MISRRFIVRTALAIAAAGCSHSEPFTTGSYTPGGPLGTGAGVQITFNLGLDRTATWLPDGSAIVYSFERADKDHCLGRLPPLGGSLTRIDCVTAYAANDSVDVLEYPVVAPDGRLAYVLSSTSRFPPLILVPDARALVLAPLDQPLDVRVLQPILYWAPSGRAHQMITSLHWLDASHLVYVGDHVTYPLRCTGCGGRDTVETGLEIAILDLAGATAVVSVVPGTDGASSVAVGATSDTIYWTKNGDSRVYRTALSSGQVDTVYDFPGGIARDVSVAGRKLAAIVGGRIAYFIDPSYDPAQVDTGGFLHVVDLVAGTDTMLGDGAVYYRRPALSPAGDRIVVEAVPLIPPFYTNLWLWEAP